MRTTTLEPLLRAARGRRTAIVTAALLPWAAVATAAAWRLAGPAAGTSALLACIVATALLATRHASRLDAAWLQRRLDALHPALEDSSGLLALDVDTLSPLQRLQRARVQERLPSAESAGVRAPWPVRRLLAGAIAAAAATIAVLAWPDSPPPTSSGAGGRAAIEVPSQGPLRLAGQRLAITPPAYTGLPARTAEALDARVPRGSRLAWALRFEGGTAPDAVALQFLDGRRIALERQDGAWQGTTTVAASGLYRIAVAPDGTWQDTSLHRIDVIPDRPPVVRVTAPAQTLTLRREGQRTWDLAFEASDDHGLAPTAELHLTMTEGSGEDIRFREDMRRLRGRGDRRAKDFSHRLDLDALGLSPGDDLIVHVVVRDDRPGGAQSTRSASHILRWPPAEASGAEGFDGVLQRVLPAYFASQRQIIIDTEALIAERPRLDDATFADRSDAIAVDQRLLRLRYGQFLGEETEPAPSLPDGAAPGEDLPPPPVLLPTNDAEDEAEAWRGMVEAGRGGADRDQDRDQDQDHAHEHGHASGAGPAPSGFGVAGDVLGEFGHTHDIPEAATLLDPRTRNLLRRALGEMWQSELALRQARPADALPPANRALALVKEIQQADRIYLSRTGTQLPPVDLARRLGGDREGIASRTIPLSPAADGDDAPASVWRALGEVDGKGAFDPAPLHGWLAAQQDRAADPLALLAALDRVEREPGCAECRTRLRALLWPLVQPPPAAPAPRSAPDAIGRAYLDALRAGGGR